MNWPHVFGTLTAGNQPASYFDDNFNVAQLMTQGTITSSALPLTATWNNGGVVFTGFKMNSL